VPPWLGAESCGHEAPAWERQVERRGRHSLVGSTGRDPEPWPQHLTADAHHTAWGGAQASSPLTTGAGCVRGIAWTESAAAAPLRAASGPCAAEARPVDPPYAPQTVNPDGWKAPPHAWQGLLPALPVLLGCWPGFLKSRHRCRTALALPQPVWAGERAATATAVTARMTAFRAWAAAQTWPAAVRAVLAQWWNRAAE
jgi:hypothetical protein